MMADAPSELADALDSGLSYLRDQHGIETDHTAREQLYRYIELLVKWNKVYNLTAVRDPVAMVWRHLVDSLVLCRYLPVSYNQNVPINRRDDQSFFDVMDIGSGAGLPVLPLALLRPQLLLASIESNGKKTRFQQQVCVELGIRNVEILNRRVQDVQSKARFVTSRAFTAPSDFLQIAQALCDQDAIVAIMLASTDTLPKPLPLNFSLQELVPIDIPGSLVPRHIALCQYNA